MTKQDYSNDGTFDFISKLGHLLPRERRKYSEILSFPEVRKYFVQNLFLYIEENYINNLRSNDLEDLILIAADTRKLLSDEVNLISSVKSDLPAWRLFVNAIRGESYLDIENTYQKIRDGQKVLPTSEDTVAGIVKAYVSKNHVRAADLPDLISSIHESLSKITNHLDDIQEKNNIPPSIPIEKTIMPDYIISLEDGKKYKTLKRHLASRGLTPEQYRSKWNLPLNYPMVAPNYSAQRSELARSIGFRGGRRVARRRAAAASD